VLLELSDIKMQEWFMRKEVIGASKGLGLSLVKKLLENGYKVAATSRNKEELIQSVGLDQEKQFLPLQVDLTNQESVFESIKATKDRFGRIDVAINNAGYGIGGTVEELSKDEGGVSVIISAEDIQRLRKIQSLKELGLSLEEIVEIITLT
jgi:NADP-dependent 3-hydroxy acid dehydrogenase YdfG